MSHLHVHVTALHLRTVTDIWYFTIIAMIHNQHHVYFVAFCNNKKYTFKTLHKVHIQ